MLTSTIKCFTPNVPLFSWPSMHILEILLNISKICMKNMKFQLKLKLKFHIFFITLLPLISHQISNSIFKKEFFSIKSSKKKSWNLLNFTSRAQIHDP